MVWTLRKVTSSGVALYAPKGVCECPNFVMATLEELAEHGIQSAELAAAGALPVPAGSASEPVLALPWAHAMPDDDLHGFLGDLVSAAMGRWRSGPEVPDRTVLADIEKVCADWRTPGEGYRGDPEPEPTDAVTKVFVPVASLRESDGEFHGLLHHSYRVGHDLPETGGE